MSSRKPHGPTPSGSGSTHRDPAMVSRGSTRLSVLFAALAVCCFALPLAWIRGEDPSALIEVEIVNDLPENLDPEEANEGAYEGGPTGTHEDTEENLNDNNIKEGADVPTDSKVSPLFGAQPFTARLLLFEEFGAVPLGPEASVTAGTDFPSPADEVSFPSSTALDAFLSQYVTPTQALPFPFPKREANTVAENPWKDEIEDFLGRTLDHPPAEGRPPGENWAHQRWTEFPPEVYTVSAQTGARTNLGLRDDLQRHGYSVGEFALGGLYHNTVGPTTSGVAQPQYNGTTNGIQAKFHPNFPAQQPHSLWTFDGAFPPKLLMARYGEPVLFRHYDALPIHPGANKGFGLHTISTHEHNGHTGAESDGYTQSFFFPGQFYDYHWPMVLAGHDTINTGATDSRAGAPNGSGGIDKIRGDWRETMSTHWFHDHMLDFTAPNVYKGNAAMMNYYSSVDRGNEAINDGVNLRFPSGTALDWGNRDYDVNLVLADKAWDSAGQLFFNIFNLDGFVGDQLLTNFVWKPYLDVRKRRYRFRILNGSVSRYFRIALVRKRNDTAGEIPGKSGTGTSWDRVPFHMIANDGNILEHSVHFNGGTGMGGFQNRKGILPTQGIAERYDIVVDFSPFAPGTKLYFVNVLEHRDGREPNDEISLQSILNGNYHERSSEPLDQPVPDQGEYDSDPCVGRFLEFRVASYSGTDQSMNPAHYVAGNGMGPNGTDLKMIPLPTFTENELENAIHRTFEFGRSSGTDLKPWTIKTDGGQGIPMDPRLISASVSDAKTEIWHLVNGGGGWSHPIHVHFEEGQIIKRGGGTPPEWERWARKDVYRIGGEFDSGDSVDFAIRFREFLGSYMEHCHNTQHEDHAMLLRWDIENPGQVLVLPTPLPSWDGVSYIETYALPTFREGDEDAAQEFNDFGHLDD